METEEKQQAGEDAGVPAEAANPDMKWYILHTYSGYEKKVMDQLRKRMNQHGLGDKVGEILVPEEAVVEIKGGKKKTSKRKFFPGYIVIQMVMDETSWHVVKDTPRITGFLGDANAPVPLSAAEVDRLREQLSGTAEKPKLKFSFQVGESVRVNEGPFANFTGVLDEVNPERGKVKVMVSIFGRATPVELEFSQIEKV
ncbi:MAG: transcription termination/antitermination protein NusG [Nitrospinae bacterium]|nr:transcription termination/antitermination protein NusG [Nitrospinota bacterium]